MDSSAVGGCALALSAAMFVACSSGTGTTAGDAGTGPGGDGGTSGMPAASTARVTFDSSITPGTHSAAECPKSGTWFTIGSFGNPALGEPVRPVDDGAADHGGTVSASCSVKPNGDGFDVAANAQLTAPAFGGAVTVRGTFKTTGAPATISLALTLKGETFSANDCAATFDAAVGQGIAAGRVWATVDCADAAQPLAQQVCKASAQLRFENCAQ